MSGDPWGKFVVPVLPEVINALKPTHLLPHLLAMQVINETEYYKVKSLPTEADAAKYLLLSVLMHRLPKQRTFDLFCRALRKVDSQKGILENLMKCDQLQARSSQPESQVSSAAETVPTTPQSDDSCLEDKEPIIHDQGLGAFVLFDMQNEKVRSVDWKDAFETCIRRHLPVSFVEFQVMGNLQMKELRDCLYFIAEDEMEMCIMLPKIAEVEAMKVASILRKLILTYFQIEADKLRIKSTFSKSSRISYTLSPSAVPGPDADLLQRSESFSRGAASESSKPTKEAAAGISALGADAEKIYEEACKEGTVPVNRCRLIVVGQDGAGKSCFVDSLFDRPFTPKNPSTKGIAIDMAVMAAEGGEDGDVWIPLDDYQEGRYLDRYFAAGYVITQRKQEEQRKEIHEQHVTTGTSSVRRQNESLDERNSSPKQFKADFVISDTTELGKYIDELVGMLTLTEEQRKMIHEYIESDEALGSLKGCEVSMKLLWDLGGQERYLTTHAALMPKESVFTVCQYLLLTNMNKSLDADAVSIVRHGAGYDDEEIKSYNMKCNRDFVRHWLSSIAIAHYDSQSKPYLGQSLDVEYPAVLIGGTHMDEVLKKPNAKEFLKFQNAELEEIIKKLKCQEHIFKPSHGEELGIFPRILEVSEDDWLFPIDNTKSGQGDKPRCPGVKAIRTTVDSSSRKYWLKKNDLTPMPVAWLRFELLLVRWRVRLGKVISFDTAKILARRSNINSEEEVEVVLKFLYGLGVIFYFWDVPSLAGCIIVDPSWLIRAVAAVVPITPPSGAKYSFKWPELCKTGKIAKDVICDLLGDANVASEDFAVVLEVLKMLDIICDSYEQGQSHSFFIPCMVTRKPEGPSAWQRYDPSQRFPPPIVIFPEKVPAIPPAMFSRLVTRFLQKYPKLPVLTVDQCSFKITNNLKLELIYLNRGDCLVASLNVTKGGNKERAFGSALVEAPEIRKFLFDSIESAKQRGMSDLQLKGFYQVAKFDPPAEGSFKIPSKILVIYCDDCEPEESNPIVGYRDEDEGIVSDERLALVHLWYEKDPRRKNAEKTEDCREPVGQMPVEETSGRTDVEKTSLDAESYGSDVTDQQKKHFKTQSFDVSNEWGTRVDTKMEYLKLNLHVTDELLNALMSKKVELIDCEKKENIRIQPTNTAKLSKLIEIIRYRGPTSFDRFCDALRNSSNDHVAKELTR